MNNLQSDLEMIEYRRKKFLKYMLDMYKKDKVR
jgi:hypothetical protein